MPHCRDIKDYFQMCTLNNKYLAESYYCDIIINPLYNILLLLLLLLLLLSNIEICNVKNLL